VRPARIFAVFRVIVTNTVRLETRSAAYLTVALCVLFFGLLPVVRSQNAAPSQTAQTQDKPQAPAPPAILASSQTTNPIFSAPMTFAAGNQPYLMVVGDFNGDGKPDLAVTNFCVVYEGSSCSSGEVTVFLGNGDGTFQGAQTYPSGGINATSVEVGDFNRDGKLDLAVVNECPSSGCGSGVVGVVSVLLGNGDGTFQPAVPYPSGGTDSDSVAVGDFNGDGKLDLVVANECAIGRSCPNGSVSVLLGNGDGTFEPAVTYLTGGPFTDSVAVGDFNGDGKLDLVVANDCNSFVNCNYGTVSLLLGNGDGTFLAATTFESLGLHALSVAAGDFNGDGKLDLVVENECPNFRTCNSSNSSLTVLLGNGEGSFETATTYPTGGQAGSSMVVGDFNGDGKADLAVADQSGASVLLGNGDGTFQAVTSYASAGIGIFSLAIGDLNGDGKPDLVAAGDCNTSTCENVGTVSVFLNIAAGFRYATTTAISSPTNPSQFGQPVTFTATVAGVFNAGPLTGPVTFFDGATVLGSAPVNNGQAIFVTSSLSLGTHSITAGYGGDTNYLPSTSPVLTETINAAAATTTTTLSSSLNPSTYGQSVTLTAAVSSSTSGTPTGSVTFTDGASTLGTASLSGGTATFTTSTLIAGSHSVIASYSGDPNFGVSTSQTLAQIVNQATSTVALASSLNPAYYGQSITFTATITPQYGGVATGTVTFEDGSTAIGSGTVNGNLAMFTTTTLPVAASLITAVYSGDGDVVGSTSPTLKQIVHSDPTTTIVTSSSNPITVGQTVTFTAMVSSSFGVPPNGGVVTFRNGTATLGTGTLSGGSATFSTSSLAAGSASINASYAGDATFLPSTSATLTETVNKYATNSSVASSMNPSSFGQSVTFTATVSTTSGGTPTGTLTFKNGNATLGTQTLSAGTASLTTSGLAVGADSITVVYSGDATNAASTSPSLSQVVSKAATSTTPTSSQNPSTAGQSVTFTATVTVTTAGTATGSVTFKSGTRALGSAALAGGIATISTTTLATGSDTITATYNGSANFTGSSGTLTQVVN
jgi:hypothetical protein